MLKRVSLFLTILFLLTTLVEAFHYHDESRPSRMLHLRRNPPAGQHLFSLFYS